MVYHTLENCLVAVVYWRWSAKWLFLWYLCNNHTPARIIGPFLLVIFLSGWVSRLLFILIVVSQDQIKILGKEITFWKLNVFIWVFFLFFFSRISFLLKTHHLHQFLQRKIYQTKVSQLFFFSFEINILPSLDSF